MITVLVFSSMELKFLRTIIVEFQFEMNQNLGGVYRKGIFLSLRVNSKADYGTWANSNSKSSIFFVVVIKHDGDCWRVLIMNQHKVLENNDYCETFQ